MRPVPFSFPLASRAVPRPTPRIFNKIRLVGSGSLIGATAVSASPPSLRYTPPEGAASRLIDVTIPCFTTERTLTPEQD